jgi:hypothetical protein
MMAAHAPRSFFLAGTMQGSRSGAAMVDQSYRRQLREVILEHHPLAEVTCPLDLMAEWLGPQADDVRAAHARLAERTLVERDRLEPPLLDLVSVFHRLADRAAACDVCVAWLPDREPSMGTAVEMAAAFRRGRTVVAITELTQNLAVLACSNVIVPGLADFDALLARGALFGRAVHTGGPG